MPIDENILRLRQAIEKVACRKIQTPKDFDFLSELLRERLDERVSTSTLKRIFGYVSSSSMPRRSTLDVLAQFVGCKEWDEFCQQAEDHTPSQEERKESSSDGRESSSEKADALTPHRGMKAYSWWLAGVLLVLIIGGLALYHLQRTELSPSQYVLRVGQRFPSTGDYLQLFGITDTAHAWSKPLPHHSGIILWGPEYHHPEWHNDGNSDSLMPTITEYWSPLDTLGIDSSVIATRNADNYLRATTFNELRITFMKGLSDSAYIFLGIYRLAEEQSDDSHLVWQRIADDCDLSNLDYLDQLRH
ncbi:MAG: hypothetical protein IJ767_05605 [Bacteroidaceae bacterium]|nr:hypothetical protein [Bacteroidaceae bacterium]